MAGSVVLASGAFPVTYGNRIGAILDINTRNGAHDRVVTRFTADALGAVLTSEGPLGRGPKGSWLLSARQSYLAYLLQRLGNANNLTTNYNDGSGKLNYDFSNHQKFTFFASYGSISAARTPNYTAGQSASSFTNGAAQHGMSTAHWDWIVSPRTLLQTQGFWVYDHEHDTNQNADVDLDTTSTVYGARIDLTHQFGTGNRLQAGMETREPQQQRNSYTLWDYATQRIAPNLQPLDAYSRTVFQTGAYLEDTETLKRLSLNVGGRWAYYSPVGQSVWLPHASAAYRVAKSTHLSAAFGQYAQMADPQQLFGAFGNPALRAERATHETVALDHFFTEKLRLHMELYKRQERDDIDSRMAEFRLLVDGSIAFPMLGPVLANTSHADAHGFEISLQRRSANKLSGWINYARSYSKYFEPGTPLNSAGDNFPGDYDQRNTVSAFAAYRISRTVGVSGNVRYGSGLPISGFLTAPTFSMAGASFVSYQLSGNRNGSRLDDFFRTDVRIDKVVTRKHFNLTIHGEIENLTGHVNYSVYGFVYPGNIKMSKLIYATRETTLPFLPVAGFTFEF